MNLRVEVSRLETYGDVINPDQISLIDGDGITTPDILGVDISNGNVPVQMINKAGFMGLNKLITYWMMMFSAPLTMRRPRPWMIPAEPSPMRVLSEATVIPRIPALSL